MSELFEKSLRTLALPRVLQLLSDQAVSAEAKERALRVSPETEPEEVLRLLDQTDAARWMTGQRGAPSFSGVKPVGEALDRADRGGALNTRELLDIAAGRKLPMLACNEYLSKVGLCSASYLTREVDKSLSGGEVKRIEIATILARDPKLAIYDEPEAGIDLWSFDRLTETFRDIHEARDGRSIVIISHQERIIQLADEIVVLRDGRIDRSGTPEDIMPQLGFVSKGIPGCQLTEPTELHLTEIPTTC